jgi:hypothetical protein
MYNQSMLHFVIVDISAARQAPANTMPYFGHSLQPLCHDGQTHDCRNKRRGQKVTVTGAVARGGPGALALSWCFSAELKVC